jgi:hypothetical protein
MAGLRDQVRAEAKADRWDRFGLSNTGHHRMRGADIASDEWEPLLRDVMQAAEIGLAFIEDETLYGKTFAAITRAREALG